MERTGACLPPHIRCAQWSARLDRKPTVSNKKLFGLCTQRKFNLTGSPHNSAPMGNVLRTLWYLEGCSRGKSPFSGETSSVWLLGTRALHQGLVTRSELLMFGLSFPRSRSLKNDFSLLKRDSCEVFMSALKKRVCAWIFLCKHPTGNVLSFLYLFH